MKEYYIFKYGKKIGPYTAEELKMRGVQRDTQIWSYDADKWLTAAEFPELAEVLFNIYSEKNIQNEIIVEKKYFVFKNNKKSGPYTVNDLKILPIYESTEICSEDSKTWEKAIHVKELLSVITGEQKYFVFKDNKKTGPYTMGELKTLPIYAATEICPEESKTWCKAIDIAELFNVITPLQETVREITKEETYFGYDLASRWQRLGAALIGGMLLYALCIPFFFIFSLGMFGPPQPPIHSLSDIDFFRSPWDYAVSFFVTFTAAAFFYKKFCGNIGHAILKLKVISSVDGSDYNKSSQGIVREFLKSILGISLILNWWILFDKRNQNLYDKITKTYVVEKKG